MKTKFSRALADEVFAELRRAFEGRCERLVAAGSFRRRRAEVGDLEILFIPRTATVKDPEDMLGATREVDDTEALCTELLARGVLGQRLNTIGGVTWGAKNKLAVHRASGLPIDLFATTPAAWCNYLVCRTGGKATNETICKAAIARGLKWCPYSEGFVKGRGEWETTPGAERLTVRTERDVFTHAGLEYLEPWNRP
jgi:DNA polymerase/3'-5' exonuclease PolX